VATLALGVTGAIIGGALGSMVGMPALGASIGWSLGVAGGTMIEGAGGSKVRVEGPRVSDLQSSDSALGEPIPIAYGSVRLAGQYIWSPKIEETRHRQTETEAGIKTVTTTYSYAMDAAIGICAGPVEGVHRIWADGKLIHGPSPVRDATGEIVNTATDPGVLLKGTIRIHLGGEDQLPDPLIQAAQGVDRTPAYRGLCYVVFEGFALADYGNRRPNLTFEVAIGTPSTFAWQPPSSGTHDESGDRIIGGSNTSGSYYRVASETYFTYAAVPTRTYFAVATKPDLWIADTKNYGLNWVWLDRAHTGSTTSVVMLEAAPGAIETVVVEYDTNSDTKYHLERVNPWTGDVLAGPLSWNKTSWTADTAAGTCSCISHDGQYLYRWHTFPGQHNRGIYSALSNDDSRAVLGRVSVIATSTMTVVNTYWLTVFRAAGDPRGVASLLPSRIGHRSQQHPDSVWVTASNLISSEVWSDPLYAADVDWGTALSYAGATVTSPLDAWHDASLITFGVVLLGPSGIRLQHHWTPAELPMPRMGYFTNQASGATGLTDVPCALLEIERLPDTLFLSNYSFLHKINLLTGNIDAQLQLAPTALETADSDDWFDARDASGSPAGSLFWNPGTGLGAPAALDPATVVLPSASNLADAWNDPTAGQEDSAQTWGLADLTTMTWTARYKWPDVATSQQTGVYLPALHAIRGSTSTVWLDKNDGSTTAADLAAIVADVCRRCGLENADLDVSELTDEVFGYTLTRRSSGFSQIEQLTACYFFDAVESDWILKFRKRDRSVTSVVPLADTGAVSGTGQPGETIEDTVTDELDLPERVDLVFGDYRRDYQPNTMGAKRPRGATIARNLATMEAAIVFDGPAEPKRIADKMLSEAWNRRPARLRLGPRWALLEPNDVITVTALNAAYTLQVRRIADGADLTVEIDAETFSSELYDSDVLAPDTSSSFPTQTAPATPPTLRTALVDGLTLPDVTGNDVGFLVGAALATDGGTWSGATVYVSEDDGETWVASGGVNELITHGTLAGGLADAATTTTVDDTGWLDVQLSTFGTLDSISRAELLTGEANLLLVGDATTGYELLQFETATWLRIGRYRLTGLVRGLRGTEHLTGTHHAGQDVWLLDPDALLFLGITDAEVGATRLVKLVPSGQTTDDVTALSITLDAASVRPWSPTQVAATHPSALSGDRRYTWIRRAGRDQSWLPWRDVELADDEVPETYEVDVLDEDGNLARTLTSASTAAGSFVDNSSQAAFYVLADAQTDHGDRHGWRCALAGGSFETGSTGWTVTAGTWTASTVSAMPSPVDGRSYLITQASAGAACALEQRCDLRQEDWHGLDFAQVESGRLEARCELQVAWRETAGPAVTLRLDLANAAGSVVANASVSYANPAALGVAARAWGTVELTVAAPASTVAATVAIAVATPGGSTRHVAVDDVRLYLNEIVGQRLLRVFQRSTTVGRGWPANTDV